MTIGRDAADLRGVELRDLVPRVRQHVREGAVVGEDQQPFGVGIKPADGEQPRQARRQQIVDGSPAALIAARGDDAARLVQGEDDLTALA